MSRRTDTLSEPTRDSAAAESSLAESIETALGDLPGIRGARADVGPTGIESVRVLVIPERTTSQTLSDVQDVMSQIVGASVDEAHIQVIRTATTSGNVRRKLSSLSLERGPAAFSVRAALELSGDVLMGESASPQGKLFERRATAEAILEGTQELVGFPLDVSRVYVINEIDHEIAIVVLSRGDEVLVGSAVVRQDEHDAIARATLDALNRFTAPIAAPEPV
ncbi:MAG TPA: hypothetical protein VG929_05560 [Actinomycetota bacterium]|nr:hypothetical protein [Actinomycetota bacterium]